MNKIFNIFSAVALILMSWMAYAKTDDEIERKLNEAQQRLEQATMEVFEISMQLSENQCPQFQQIFVGRDSGGAMLGVYIEQPNDKKNGSGVSISSVTPNSPVDRAGIRTGDKIVSLNGTKLAWKDSNSPVEQLLTIMADVGPEEVINVEYERDGKTNKVEVKTKRFATATLSPFCDVNKRMLIGKGRRTPHIFNCGLDVLPPVFFFNSESIRNPELVSLTPKLGSYFAAEKGLLVVRAGKDSYLALEDGDVIVNIDDRELRGPAHATRILSSYQAGEIIKLSIVREKRKKTLEVEVNEEVLNSPVNMSNSIRQFKDLKRRTKPCPYICKI